MTSETHRWCGNCREDSAINHSGACLWCGGPTEQRRKRGGWKRPDLRGSRYTKDQLRVLRLAYERGESINSLAKQTFEVVGYTSHASASRAISREWKRMGLEIRDQATATVQAHIKHGLARKHEPNIGYSAYKRRELRGEPDRPRCKGVRARYPRQGEQCRRPAMRGSEFCSSHDPNRRAEVKEFLARQKPTREMVPMAPFTAWLRRRHAELGSWEAVGGRINRSLSLAHRYGRGVYGGDSQRPKTEIGRETVVEMLEADGTTAFHELYGIETTETLARAV